MSGEDIIIKIIKLRFLIKMKALIKEDYWKSKGQLHKVHIIFDAHEFKTGLV